MSVRQDDAYREVDVSAWIVAGPESGSKPKEWLFHPSSGSVWLWKESTTNASRGELYRKGDDWAEKIATELAGPLGVPVPPVELAMRDGLQGTICRDFTAGRMQFDSGAFLLEGVIPAYSEGSARYNPRYSLGAVMTVLQAIEAPPVDALLMSAEGWFGGYLLLDAWIGNTDRHDENWGTLRSPGSQRRFLAPSFDHASSLGFLLSDGDRLTLLDGQQGLTVERWADKARSPFVGRGHPRSIAGDLLSRLPRFVRDTWIERLDAAMAEVDRVVNRVPSHRMSPEAKSFAMRLLRHNGIEMMSI